MIGLHFLVCVFLSLMLLLGQFMSSVHAQCQWEYNNTSITCRLKALDAAGIDLQPAEEFNELHIECSDQYLFESELHKQVFSGLKKLVELNVHACKLHQLAAGTFNGLSALRKLSINTKNSEWGVGKSLELYQDSLQGLKTIEVLNLADNNIRALPDGVFCHLNSLQTLNLTQNRVRSVEGFGLARKPCVGEEELRVLDLSANALQVVPEGWSVSRLRRLDRLNLQVNNITEIAGEALAGLTSLRIFNISQNQLETLPSELFRNSRDLQEIHLQHNRLYELPRLLFHRLEHLLILDLSNNQLTSHHVDNTTFSGLIRLVVLNLAHNAVTRIDGKTFKDLYFLQILDLRNNSIGYIEDNTFLPLYNLHTLNLAENRLHTLNADLFNGLSVLAKLTLNNNLIGVIEANTFRNCSDLKELDLSSNQLIETPEALQNLTMLKTLDLGENQITEIRNDSFRNLQQLTGLRLIDNQIGNISRGMFDEMPRLSVLNLAKNRIQSIERGSFDKNKEIEALRLDKNSLTDINGVFATLSSLLWLNLAENHLVWFDYAFIPSNLKWLDVHANYIESLGNYYKLQEEIRVKTLDASHNRITEIGPMSIPNSVELLFINSNFVNTIHPNTFVDKTNLTRADLYSNAISKIHLHTLRLAPVPVHKPLPEFYLGGNPLECDCTMEWLQSVNNLTSRQHPRIMDLQNVECQMPHARGAALRSVTTLKPDDFLCRYETHCFALCHCCDFDACDCEMTCPQNCTCFHDQTWSTNVVDCGGQGASDLPRKVPMDATVLYLDGNVIEELKSNVFIGRKNLRTLFVNGSEVARVQKRAFAGLQTLVELHLETNRLTILNGYEFENLNQLRILNLQGNQLEYIGNETFAPLVSLRSLRIDGNKIVTLPLWVFHSPQFQAMESLTMGRNSWSCRCAYLREMSAFVSDKALAIEDSQDIYCIDGVIKHELDFNSTSDCNGFYEGRSVLPELVINEHIPLLVAAILLIFVFIILVMAIVFREPLRVWLFAKCGVRICEPACEDYEKLYDAVFLYSEKDFELVCREIAAELEIRPPPLRLCLQHRDLARDATYLQILETARASKRVVLLISRNFLQTEWNRYEVRNAIHEAVKDRPQKLVIIEEPDAAADAESDMELLPYMKSRAVNRLKLTDRHFWEKLRYALPAEIQQRCNNYTLHQHERFRQPTGIPMQVAGNQPPPSYCPESDDANYSSATTATPSPRPSRRVAVEPSLRPPSEHIYFSIDSDYNGVIPAEAMHQHPQVRGSWRHPPHKSSDGHSYMV